jgi:ribosomal protein S18 acetylase RimI-like enzyme
MRVGASCSPCCTQGGSSLRRGSLRGALRASVGGTCPDSHSGIAIGQHVERPGRLQDRPPATAEQQGRLVGFLIGFLSPDRPEEGYIHFVGVAPDARRTSVGRHLYERFFETCRLADRTCVRCVTSPENTLSIAFHRAMGFAVEPGTEGTGPVLAKADYDGPSVHRVAFVRAL